MNRHRLPGAIACLLLAMGIAAQAAKAQDYQIPGDDGYVQAGPAYAQVELDQLLAPIALYPDPLISQVLMAATYPMEVIEAARFVDSKPGLKGQALANAIEPQAWDASVKSLVGFPSVLAMMTQNLEWTQKLGDAFLAQPDGVMDTIQNLRRRAQAQGTLRDTAQQRIWLDQQIISIQPAQADVLYVPYYDPNVVYGNWWAPSRRPYYWTPSAQYRSPTFGEAVTSGIVFGLGVAIVRSVFSSPWRPDWRRGTFSSVDGRSPAWRHDPVHRRGMAYRDMGTRERFSSRPTNSGDRPDFRGHEGGRYERRPEMHSQPRAASVNLAPASPAARAEIRHAPPPQQANPFAHIESRARVERHSERGHREMANPAPAPVRTAPPPAPPQQAQARESKREHRFSGDRHHGR